MATIRTYKPFLASFLVVLYAFIASVQLLHHHAPKAGLATFTGPSTRDAVAEGLDSSAEADCPVCSHQFLAFKLDTLLPLESLLAAPVARNGYYRLPVVAGPSFSLPNKGPPGTACIFPNRS